MARKTLGCVQDLTNALHNSQQSCKYTSSIHQQFLESLEPNMRTTTSGSSRIVSSSHSRSFAHGLSPCFCTVRYPAPFLITSTFGYYYFKIYFNKSGYEFVFLDVPTPSVIESPTKMIVNLFFNRSFGIKHSTLLKWSMFIIITSIIMVNHCFCLTIF